ncbi:MAG: hypothetical protein IKB34_09145, partial [Clostridia bacterium]|nr:hypothetical protein [Clostridia bacterium]
MLTLKFLRAMFTVPQCIVCGKQGVGIDLPMCEACQRRYLTEKAKSCTLCGFPHIVCRCGVNVSGRFYTVYHAVPYDPKTYGAVSRIVFNAKDIYLRDNFDFIARECFRVLNQRTSPGVDWIITWIPRRKSSVKKHGHDQSREIAKRVARLLGCRIKCLFSNHGESEQKSQNFEGRLRNAFASYRLRKGAENTVSGRTVVVIDDLITTGATQHAAIALLSRAG